eukprot:SAG11_NODE_301_length_11038_cov_2.312826_10_plen_125_part_00
MEMANKEMKNLTERENVTESEIAELLQKYEAYPAAEVRHARDALKSRQILFMTTVQDSMRRLATRSDVTLKELDDAIAEYTGREELVGEALKAVQDRRKQLSDGIAIKLKEGTKLVQSQCASSA